jgi:hypothetical protein
MPQKQSGKKTAKASKDDPPLKDFSLSRYFPKARNTFMVIPLKKTLTFLTVCHLK